MIAVAEQVEDAVNKVADNLRLPGTAEAASLEDGFVNADEELAEEVNSGFRVPSSSFGVVERNHVG